MDRLVAVLDEMDAAPLSAMNSEEIPDAQGVYQLFLDDALVYIGKTDAKDGLSHRLRRHARKIMHRVGLDPLRVSFRAVRIYVFTAVDLESQLIRHYGGLKDVSWNGSGFGSNDPGRRRDTTTYKNDHYDVLFPIDIDYPLEIELKNSSTANEVLAELKSKLPYVFRFQNKGPRLRQPHSDLSSTLVRIPVGEPMTARSIIEQVVSQLPVGWQATKLVSHLILYKENINYPQETLIIRSQ